MKPVCLFLAVAVLSMPPAKVRVGYCTGLKNLEAAKAAGFDYVELPATEIAALSDADFEAAAARLKQLGIPTPTANLFLPATLKVTGPDTNPEQQMLHVRKALTRLARLGTEIVVFGSGGARRVPDGFAKDEAFKQLVDFGRRAAGEARANGITIAIEPLRKQETNIINTAAEGLELVDHIRHLHMANPTGRVFPQKWEEFDYAPFFANLRAIGYDKRISVEGNTTDLAAQGPAAVALLRQAFER